MQPWFFAVYLPTAIVSNPGPVSLFPPSEESYLVTPQRQSMTPSTAYSITDGRGISIGG